MSGQSIPYVLTFGPLVLAFAAWVRICWAQECNWQNASGLIALGMVSVSAIYGAGTLFYYGSAPPSHLPPWKDPGNLDLAGLFPLAAFGIILGGIAAFTGAPKWLAYLVVIASLPLLAIGIMAGISV